MATWDDVLRLALALPDTEASTYFGQPAVKVRGRSFVSMSGREEGALVLPRPREEQRLLCAALPAVYYVTPHYEGWDGVLARLSTIDEDELAGAIEDSYAFTAAKGPARPRR